jgi:hypothetical protein
MNRDYTANCAICNGPGDPECPCEGDRLKIAIDQAEKKWIESWIGKTRYDMLVSSNFPVTELQFAYQFVY